MSKWKELIGLIEFGIESNENLAIVNTLSNLLKIVKRLEKEEKVVPGGLEANLSAARNEITRLKKKYDTLVKLNAIKRRRLVKYRKKARKWDAAELAQEEWENIMDTTNPTFLEKIKNLTNEFAMLDTKSGVLDAIIARWMKGAWQYEDTWNTGKCPAGRCDKDGGGEWLRVLLEPFLPGGSNIKEQSSNYYHTWKDCENCEYCVSKSVPSLIDGSVEYTCRFTRCFLERGNNGEKVGKPETNLAEEDIIANINQTSTYGPNQDGPGGDEEDEG